MFRDSISRVLHGWANLPVFVRLTVLLVAAGGGGLLVFKPAYRLFEQWRLERNLGNAKQALGGQRMQEARDLSLSVLRSGDPRIEAVRILEKSTSFLRDPRHAEIARALVVHPQGTDDDRLEGFRGVVDQIPLGLVGQVWVALPEHCQQDPRFAQAFASRLLKESRLNEATLVLLAVAEKSRSAACRRSLVSVLVRSGSHDTLVEAQQRISRELPVAGEDFPQWLELLESIPVESLNPRILGAAREHLREQGDASARCSLMIARMEYAVTFPRSGEVIDRMMDRWAESEPVELARFLGALGLHRRILELFPNDRIGHAPDLFPLLLSSAVHASDWHRMKSLVEENAQRLSKLEQLGYRAVVAAKTDDAVTLSEAWAAAMNEASGATSNDSYLVLRRLTLEANLVDLSNQALLAAIRTGNGPLPLYADLKPLLQSLAAQAQEKAILEVGAIYLSYEPSNPVLLTQYAYLACLNELAEPAAILQALEPMAKALPREVPLQCALAAAYLCDSKPEQALRALEPLKLDANTLPPQFRVILMTSLVLNGKLNKDDPSVLSLPWKQLLPSERRKFGDLIRKSGA